MASVVFKTAAGTASLPLEALQALRGMLRGGVCLPGDPGYDEHERSGTP